MTSKQRADLASLIEVLRANGVREYEGAGFRLVFGAPTAPQTAAGAKSEKTTPAADESEVFAPTSMAELLSVLPKRH